MPPLKDRILLIWAVAVVLAAAWVLAQTAEPEPATSSRWVSGLYLKQGQDLRPIDHADLVGLRLDLGRALRQVDHLVDMLSSDSPIREAGRVLVILDSDHPARVQVSRGVVWVGGEQLRAPWVLARASLLSLIVPSDRGPNRAEDLVASIWTMALSASELAAGAPPLTSWIEAWKLTDEELCSQLRAWVLSERLCASPKEARSRLIDHRLELEGVRLLLGQMSPFERVRARASLEQHLLSLRNSSRHSEGVADLSGLGIRRHLDLWLGNWMLTQSAGEQRRHAAFAQLGLSGSGDRFLAPPRKLAFSLDLLAQIPAARPEGGPRPRVEEVVWDQCEVDLSAASLGLRLSQLPVIPNAMSFPAECQEQVGRRLDISIVGQTDGKPFALPSRPEKNL